MGIGKQMNGADMFVMYANGNGNVTLSTRRGLNHIMPEYNSKSGVELLAGSGVSNGQMVANVRCSSCSELKLTSSNGWLSAWKRGSALDSTSPEAQIDYHDGNALFSVDFSKATISEDKNPFVGSDDGGSGSGGSGSGGSGGGNSPGGGVVVESDPNQTLIYAHGIIMSVVFLLGYPIGSMLMPLLGKWALHAGWQLVTFLAMWAGFGVGYILARRTDLVSFPRFAFLHSYSLLTRRDAVLQAMPLAAWCHPRLSGQHTTCPGFPPPPTLPPAPAARHRQPPPRLVWSLSYYSGHGEWWAGATARGQ